MARSYSNRGWSRRGRRANIAYLVVALVLFALIVFVLFRGHSSEPQVASAGAVGGETNPPEQPAEPAPSPAGEPEAQPESPTPAGETGAQRESAPVSVEPEVEANPLETLIAADPPAAPSDANAEAARAIAEALALGRSQPGSVIEVRDKLNTVLAMPLSESQRRTVKEEMSRLADEWLFGPAAFAGDPLCGTYTVKSGDVLEVIGRRHKVPHEMIMQINNIRRPRSLGAGRAIKVIHGPFHAKVYRSTFTLDLYLQDTFVRSFKVGLGVPATPTPTGLWRVKEGGKLIQPPWYDQVTNRTYKASDPDYPLGSRWVALDGVDGDARGRTGFAIHGTKDPDQIGTAGSRGCIRMYNGDAILVYNLLVPLDSKVEVVD
ncbi:MAG: L,D-transpeptidase family protein [Sedimentisphaerales bacterium]|nr:L,D-transpeptidase family protein [Sedimentisphaerales bacterium]